MFYKKCSVGFGGAALLAALALVGCAHPSSGPAAADPAAGLAEARQATVHVYRVTGGAAAPEVLMNSQNLGRLGESGNLQYLAPVGPAVLEVVGLTGSSDALAGTRLAFMLSADQPRYWRLEIRPSAGGLTQAVLAEVPAAQARQEIRQITR